jgi:hypothetical protein
MKTLIFLALMGLVALALLWPKKSGQKRMPARTWPAGRRKLGLKPKLTSP